MLRNAAVSTNYGQSPLKTFFSPLLVMDRCEYSSGKVGENMLGILSAYRQDIFFFHSTTFGKMLFFVGDLKK